MRLSHIARETIDLARSGTLGRKFPTWEQMVKEAEGDFKKLARIISDTYGNVSEEDVRSYIKMYKVNIKKN